MGTTTAGNPVASKNRNGNLEVFDRGSDGSLEHSWQPPATFGSWYSLGGGMFGDPSATTNVNGNLEAFVVGTDRKLYHNWQTTPSGGWAGWYSLGGWAQNP